MTSAVQRPRHDYLAPPFEDAMVFDVMHAGVLSCALDTTLEDAARVMSAHGVHAIVVENLGAHERPWRLFGAMDLVRGAGEPGTGASIGDLASEDAVTVAPDAPLATACALMADRGVPHLVVVHGGRPIGVLSTTDVIRALGRAQPRPDA